MFKHLNKSMLGLLSLFACDGFYAQATDLSPYQVQLFETPESAHMIVKNYRGHWPRLTGFEYSGLHWNQFISVYTNIGEATYKNNYMEYIAWYEDPDDEENEPVYTKYPEGAVILKENFSSESGRPGMPISVTAMIKRGSDYDPGKGNWEYLQFDAQGKIILQGNSNNSVVSKNCANCHGHVESRDYVFSQIFSTVRSE
jgi:hypothetical protein